MRSCNGGGHNGSLLCSSGGSEDSGGSDAAPGSDKLEGPGAVTDDPIHLQRRVGLVSGVALIVGTMIGKFNFLINILIKSFFCVEYYKYVYRKNYVKVIDFFLGGWIN